MSEVLGGLAINGKLIMIGASEEPLEVSPNFFLSGRRSVVGWPSGSSIDSQDTLSFSVLSGVRSMNEVFPARACSRGLRANDKRQGTISSGPYNRTLVLPLSY